MESCRKICPIILALEYVKSEHQREIDEFLPRSISAADEISKIEEDNAILSVEDDPLATARKAANISIIKALETLSSSHDTRITMIDDVINKSVKLCGRGPVYSGGGRLVLACGGVTTIDAKLHLRTRE